MKCYYVVCQKDLFNIYTEISKESVSLRQKAMYEDCAIT